jgi:hypothetical protein
MSSTPKSDNLDIDGGLKSTNTSPVDLAGREK